MAKNANIKIGPVRLTVDPDNITVVDSKVNTIIPGLRSDTVRTVSTGQSTIGIRMGVVFPNQDDINNKLRRIIAYFKAVPFQTIKSDTINRLVASKITQRVAEASKTDPALIPNQIEKRSKLFETQLILLVIDSLIEEGVVSYLASEHRDINEEVRKYLNTQTTILANPPKTSDKMIVKSLATKYVSLNYAVANAPGVTLQGATSKDQIDHLITELFKLMALKGQSNLKSVTGAVNQGVKQLTSTADVQDGDTIRVDGIWQRIYGVDAFESVMPGSGTSPPGQGREGGYERYYATLAADKLKQLMFDGAIGRQFQMINRGTDFYDRGLATVQILAPQSGTEKDIALELIKIGYALPSAVSNGGEHASPGDLPYLRAGLAAAEAGEGFWGYPQLDVQLPSLWRKYAADIKNFEPPFSSSAYLRNDLIPSTVVTKDSLKKLMRALISQQDPGTVTRQDEFTQSALSLVDAYFSDYETLTSQPEDPKSSTVVVNGFPNDIVPVIFNGITYSAISEMPDSIQAEFTFTLFNHYPYTPRMEFITAPSDTEVMPTDPDISYSQPLDQLINDTYLGYHAISSDQSLDKYDRGNILYFHYKEVVLKAFKKGLVEAATPAISDTPYAPPDEQIVGLEQLDTVYKPTFVDKMFIIDPAFKEAFQGEETVTKIGKIDIESISVTLTNNIVAVPLEGTPIPTAQHLGKGATTVVIELATVHEDTLTAFRTIDSSIQSASMVGYQYKTPSSFRVVNSVIGIGGVNGFVFDNIIMTTDSEIPGKTNIKIILLESNPTYDEKQQKLIPKFETSLSNPEQTVKAVTDFVVKNPAHNFTQMLFNTFLPTGGSLRHTTYPLALVFAHTRKDIPTTVGNAGVTSPDYYQLNAKLRDEFIALAKKLPKKQLPPLLKDIDEVWVKYPRESIKRRNEEYNKVKKAQSQKEVDVIPPWGYGPGDLTGGSGDAWADRYGPYVYGNKSEWSLIKAAITKSIDNISKEYIGIDTEYGYALGILCHKFGQMVINNEKPTVGQENKELGDMLFYLFKEALISPVFTNLFGQWITNMASIFPDAFFTNILPPRTEPTTFRDLKLPTYRQVFGRKMGMLARNREIIVGHLFSLRGFSETSNSLSILPQSRIASPEEFKNLVLGAIVPLEENVRATQDTKAIQKFEDKKNTIVKLTNDLYDQETSKYLPVVPDAVLPTYEYLGIPVPPGSSPSDIARHPDDIVEPGWMYNVGYLDRWNKFAKLFDINKIKEKVHGPFPVETITFPAVKLLSTKDDNTKDEHFEEDYSKEVEARNKMLEERGFPPKPANQIIKNAYQDASGVAFPNKNEAEAPSVLAKYKYKSSTKTAMGKDQDIYSNRHFGTMMKAFDKGAALSSMKKAYPGYAIYFLEEDAEDWGYLDDYYRYDAVISWDVVMAKDIPDIATIRFANYKGILTNSKEDIDLGSERKGPDATTTTEKERVDQTAGNRKAGQPGNLDEGVVTAFKLKTGTRIMIKAGYSTKADEMEVLFTGQVAEVMPGDITSVICQSYMSQLYGYMGNTFARNQKNFPEILNLMLRDTTYFGKWEMYVQRLEGQNKQFMGDRVVDKIKDLASQAWFGKKLQDAFPDTSDDNIYLRNEDTMPWNWAWTRIWDPWKVKGPVWENILTMTRYVPNTVVAVRPYDGRATLFFGSPDSTYIFTNRFPANPGYWSKMLAQNTLEGNLDNLAKSKASAVERLLGTNGDSVGSSYLENIDKVTEGDYFYGSNAPKQWGTVFENLTDDTIQLAFALWLANDYNVSVTPLYRSNVNDFFEGAGSVAGRNDAPDKKMTPGNDETLGYLLNEMFRGVPPEEEKKLERTVQAADVKLESNNLDLIWYAVVSNRDWKIAEGSSSNKHLLIRVKSGTPPVAAKFIMADQLARISGIANLPTDSSHGAFLKKFISSPEMNTLIKDLSKAYQAVGGSDKKKKLNAVLSCQPGYDKIKPPGNLSLGYISLMIGENIHSVFHVKVVVGNSFLRRFMTEFVPHLYSLRAWAASNPGTFMSDYINSNGDLNNYLMAPNERPFRRAHFALNGYNIIKNDIVATMAQSANVVSVVSGGDEILAPMPVTESLINKYSAMVYDENASAKIGKTQVAMSVLGEKLRMMYRGQLTLLGDEKIKPYDLVRIDDHYNLMYGPIEVDRVVHSFNSQTGYTTSIVPHLIVRVQEDLGYWTAIGANLWGGFKSLALLAGSTAGGWLVVGVGGAVAWPAALVGGVIGLSIGALTCIAGRESTAIDGTQEYSFLSIPVPSLSSQGRFDESRLNPVRIQPLFYRGAPYVVGLEGWGRNNWTLAEAKKYREQLRDLGSLNTRMQIAALAHGLTSPISSWYDIAGQTGEGMMLATLARLRSIGS